MNFQMFKMVLEKAEETRDQMANICWIIKKAREFQKNIYFCFTDYAKAFGYVDHNTTPQFKNINSLALSLCSPTLTFIRDYWKNHSFD